METNETLPLSQEEAKKRLVTVLALRINAQKRVDLHAVISDDAAPRLN
jgi:hypothetical protein